MKNPLVSLEQWSASHASVLFFIWSLWLTFPHFVFGPWSHVSGHDESSMVLPAKLTFSQPHLSSRLGYWRPQWVAGVDRSAAPYTTDLDSLLFIMLPGWLAYGLIKWLQAFIAGYFGFRLLRDSLGIGALPSLYVGIAFSTSGYGLSDGLGLSGLPFILWTMSLVHAQRKFQSYLCSIGLGFFLALNSVYFLSMFLLPVIFFWVLFVEARTNSRVWVALILFTGAWFLGEMPTMVANFMNVSLSHKADWDQTTPSHWQKRLSQTSSFLWTYSISLGFALIGLIASRGRDRRLVSLLGGLFFFLSLVPASYLFQVMARNHLGFLSGFQLSRIILPLRFLAFVSGGIGIHLVASQWSVPLVKWTPYRISLKKVLLTGAIGLVVVQSLIMKRETVIKMLQGYGYSVLYMQPELQQFANSRRNLPPFRVATVCNIPAFAWAYGLETVDGYLNLYSKRYQKYWGQVITRVTESHRALYDEFHLWGNRAYLFTPPGACVSREGFRFKDYYDLELLSLANVRFIISTRPLRDGSLALLPSNMRDEQLKWIMEKNRNALDKIRSVVEGKYQGIPLYIYENQEALPRFFLVNHVEIFDNPNQVLVALRHATHNDLRSKAYLARADVSGLPLELLGGKGGKVALVAYSSDQIILDVTTESAAILIVTNNYSPYWRGVVNRIPVKIFPVDHTFQGVYLDPGQHAIVLKYAPPYSGLFLGLTH